jgi:glutamyl-tRNA synthetase
MSELIRTRFAPSPTGKLHIGGLRTALFNWLYAASQDGEFLLRLEDTDQARFDPDAEAQISESLQWLGLDWQGEVVHQSERLDRYRELALQLIAAGWAYVADETAEEIAAAKDAQRNSLSNGQPWPPYPSRTKSIDPAEYGSGTQVIRFRWPDDQALMTVASFDAPDQPREVAYDPANSPSAFEDFVIMKADGYPTYNFAHVVDDHDSGITDIFRGDEFVSSLNKYQRLHDALEWQRPRYFHVPPIVGADKKKLSKRLGSQDALAYRDAGFLPETLANFLALLGWSPGNDREVFLSLAELTETFGVGGIQKSPAVFDEEKLTWLSGEHLRAKDPAELLAIATEGGFWSGGTGELDQRVLAVEQPGLKTLADLAGLQESFYYHRPTPDTEALRDGNPVEIAATRLERVQRELESIPAADWSQERLQSALTDARSELDLKPKELFPILRIALTASPQSPAIWDVMWVLGRQESLDRLEAAAALIA